MPHPSATGKTEIYWYLTFQVTNKTGAARPLDLGGRLETTVKLQPSLRPVLATDVTKAIAERHGLEDLTNVLGAKDELADQAVKNMVIVFHELSPLADSLNIRLTGFANRVHRVGKTTWNEVREFSIEFKREGDEYRVTSHPIRKVGHEWITVSKKKITG
jgi:hypothetical protein